MQFCSPLCFCEFHIFFAYAAATDSDFVSKQDIKKYRKIGKQENGRYLYFYRLQKILTLNENFTKASELIFCMILLLLEGLILLYGVLGVHGMTISNFILSHLTSRTVSCILFSVFLCFIYSHKSFNIPFLGLPSIVLTQGRSVSLVKLFRIIM